MSALKTGGHDPPGLSLRPPQSSGESLAKPARGPVLPPLGPSRSGARTPEGRGRRVGGQIAVALSAGDVVEQRVLTGRAADREVAAWWRIGRPERIAVWAALGLVALLAPACGGGEPPSNLVSSGAQGSAIGDLVSSLPEPRLHGTLSLEEALARRRSVRDYADASLTLEQLSQLLWSAQGITESRYGLRTAPSAGALYPLEVYVAVERVDGLRAGVYRYAPRQHRLELVLARSVREQLCRDALSQSAVVDAPVTLAFAAVFERTTRKYGERGRRYVAMEVGHAAQNVCLQATALGLGTVVIGAFEDGSVQRTLGMRGDEEPLYLMPVGRLPSQ